MLGDVGTPLDISCQIVNCQVAWGQQGKDDDLVVLCGEDTVAGAKTYTATLTGNLLQDQVDPDGVVRYSWENKGTEVPFVFVPNSADAVEVSGVVVIDLITVGSDTAGANMDSDFTWDCVGEPVLAGRCGSRSRGKRHPHRGGGGQADAVEPPHREQAGAGPVGGQRRRCAHGHLVGTAAPAHRGPGRQPHPPDVGDRGSRRIGPALQCGQSRTGGAVTTSPPLTSCVTPLTSTTDQATARYVLREVRRTSPTAWKGA